MPARITELDSKHLPLFTGYCRKHRTDHDESFLSEDELSRFSIEKNITFIAVKENRIAGVYSLIPQKKYRVRIFHAEGRNTEIYRMLHQKMIGRLKTEKECSTLVLFMPDNEKMVIEFLKELGYRTERYVFVLEREIVPVRDPLFPEGFRVTEMSFPEDIDCWMKIRNLAFENLTGSLPAEKNDISGMKDDSDYIKEGTLILRDDRKAVGIIKVSRDIRDNGTYGFIGPVAVLLEYQGKGLGRNLLRTAVKFTVEKLKWKNSLCVNADNEDALKLYLDEGFRKMESVAAMKLYVND